MIENSSPSPALTRAHRAGAVRTAFGLLFALVAVAALTLWTWGAWNPQRYVLLLSHFRNPVTGVFAVAVGVALAVWLLAPVRNEAAQGRRNAIRWTLLIIAVITGLAAALVGDLKIYRYQGHVLARSGDGRIAVVRVELGRPWSDVRVWSGDGVTAREIGRFGMVCGDPVTARFVNPGEVRISTSYGDFTLRLDATGHPRNHKGQRCDA